VKKPVYEAKKLYWTIMSLEEWRFIAAATEEGLVYVAREEEPYPRFARWKARHYPGWISVQDDDVMRPYVQALETYWSGRSKSFDIPVISQGTEFQQLVWKELKRIAYGETCSYADIAERIGKPTAVRAVGSAIGANPLLIIVPCHRVLSRSGSLTGYSGGLDLKERLLEIEGVWTTE
jgi:methylated-DNA-[protein]-cysteine S-methyltransferase